MKTHPPIVAARALLAAALVSAAGPAWAESPVPGGDLPPAPPSPAWTQPDTVAPPPDDADKRIDRTWLYLDDAKIPAPFHVVVTTSVSYTTIGSPTRIAGGVEYNTLAVNTATPGAMVGVGGEIGLFPRVSLMMMVDVTGGGQGPSPSAGLVAGLRVQAFPSRWRDTHLVVSAGYLREAWQGPEYDDDNPSCMTSNPGCWSSPKPYGDSGAWIQAAFSQDFSRLRLAATIHAEHVFAAGRDPLDVMVQAGASCRIVGGFRLGAEYVGQDLEEVIDPGAEGGVRHFLGPTASLQLLRDRLTLVAGPSVGLNARSPELLGRAAAAFGF